MKQILYSIDRDTGMVWSQMVNNGRTEGWCIPVYQFGDFGDDGDFTGPIPVKLEKFSHNDVTISRPSLIHTRKIPTELKNRHRGFWGMKPLKPTAR